MSEQIENPSDVTFDLTFEYCLNEEGRIASLQSGGNGKEGQSIKGTISLSQFLKDFKPFGGKITETGGISPSFLSLKENAQLAYYKTPEEYAASSSYSSDRQPYWRNQYYSQPQTFEALLQDWLATKRDRAAVLAQAKAERQRLDSIKAAEEVQRKAEMNAKISKAVDDFLVDPAQRATIYTNSVGVAFWDVKPEHPRYAELRAEAEKRVDADKAAKEKDERERTEAKAQQVAAWVAVHGDDNQKARYAAGLFPETEALKAIEATAWEPLLDFPLFAEIEKSEVRAECDDDCVCSSGYNNCKVTCDTIDAPSADASEWDSLTAIRAALPNAEISLKEVSCACTDNDCKTGEITRRYFYAKIVVGAFTFTRKFAV